MKKLILTILAISVTLISIAQRPFATLEHEGTVTAFYGTSALMAAVDSAVDGDIITLSPGEFIIHYGDEITKAVTILGAGMHQDTIHGVDRTIIKGEHNNYDIRLSIPNGNNHLVMEGLYINAQLKVDALYHPIFRKCFLREISTSLGMNSTMVGAQFIQCICMYYHNEWENRGHTTTWSFRESQFINSVIYNSYSNGYGYTIYNYANETMVNSIVTMSSEPLNDMTVKNCIIFGDGYNHGYENVGITSSYSIGINTHYYGGQIFDTAAFPGRHLYNYSSLNQVFQTFTNENEQWSNPEGVDFHLLPSIASTILGDDGTEIGIYGGAHPFDPRVIHHTVTVPSIPTEQGILNIQINTLSE